MKSLNRKLAPRAAILLWGAGLAILIGQAWVLMFHSSWARTTVARWMPLRERIGGVSSFDLEVFQRPDGFDVIDCELIGTAQTGHPFGGAEFTISSSRRGFCNPTAHFYWIAIESDLPQTLTDQERAEIGQLAIDELNVFLDQYNFFAEHSECANQIESLIGGSWNGHRVAGQVSTPIPSGHFYNLVAGIGLVLVVLTSWKAMVTMSRFFHERLTMVPEHVCRRCGYDLSGLSRDSVCPECGE